MSYERRKVRVGKVVSDKMDKTVVVVVGWRRPHRVYQKPVRRETRFMAHDPQNLCKIGDTVRIRECRPISKTKRWRIEEILQREDIAEIQPGDIITPAVAEDAAPAPVAQPTAAAIDAKVAVEPDDPPADVAPVADAEQGESQDTTQPENQTDAPEPEVQDNAPDADIQATTSAENQSDAPGVDAPETETQPETQQEEPRQ